MVNREKWEYFELTNRKTDEFRPDINRDRNQMNELGEMGFELVSIIERIDNRNKEPEVFYQYWFKRKLVS